MRLSISHQISLLILYTCLSVSSSLHLSANTGASRTFGYRNLLSQAKPVNSSGPTQQKVRSQSFTKLKSVTMSDGSSNEPWTKARLHNTSTFRSIAILGAIAAAGLSTNSPFRLLSAQSMAALHLFSFATWFGTMFYTTFILGITMFKNLPRKTFGTLQSKLFPLYFSLSSIAIIIQIITLKGLTANAAASTIGKSTKSLIVALVMTLLNQFIIEPMTSNNMLRRYELEDTVNGKDTDEYKVLKSNFGKFHGISSLTNLIAICAAAAHGFYLSAAFV